MYQINIYPDKFAQFKNPKNKSFYLVLPREFVNNFNLLESKQYEKTEIILSEDFSDINEILINTIKDNSDALLIPFQVFRRSFPKVSSISQNTRVLTLGCGTSHHNIEEINHFISMLYQIEP